MADDHEGVRHSLRQLLDDEPDVEVIAEASDMEAVLTQVQGQGAHVLVLDLGMLSGLGVSAIGELTEGAPRIGVVVATMQDNPAFAQRALTAGALGFVSKELADGELADAIRAAARGEQYISPKVAGRLDALHQALTEDELTSRETEVLRLIALGHTSVEMARKLKLSPRTVETHRAHIHHKLGLGAEPNWSVMRYDAACSEPDAPISV